MAVDNLVCLIGEQPIPNLLPVRALQPKHTYLAFTSTTSRIAGNLAEMIEESELVEIEAYDLTKAVNDLDDLCDEQTAINLTGGTKPMALAAYEVARSRGLPIFYLQSEGRQTLIYSYQFQNGRPVLKDRYPLPSLITIDDYLQAHGMSPTSMKKPANYQEETISRWLNSLVDEYQSNLVFDAYEIDFLMRRGNRVAVMEAKMKSESTREGIDQLNTICGRAYLGTYTGKILITTKKLGWQLTQLAEERRIEVVHMKGRTDQATGIFSCDPSDKEILRQALDFVLGPMT